ncbi:hypothetical protein HMPREF9554_02315 [Treponema phagedenis F0421]|nr:hypothetical protein HMPREF9554_02315 [Treponema phagedenis F0421]
MHIFTLFLDRKKKLCFHGILYNLFMQKSIQMCVMHARRIYEEI